MKFGNTVVSASALLDPDRAADRQRLGIVARSARRRRRRVGASGREQLGRREAAERVGLGEVAQALRADLRVQRLRAVAEAGLDAEVRVGRCRCRGRSAPRARSGRPAASSARSSAAWSPRWLAGANATRAAQRSARASTCAAATPPTARRGRPASGRRSRPACRSFVELARGADHVEHAAALGDADQVRMRRRACRGPS